MLGGITSAVLVGRICRSVDTTKDVAGSDAGVMAVVALNAKDIAGSCTVSRSNKVSSVGHGVLGVKTVGACCIGGIGVGRGVAIVLADDLLADMGCQAVVGDGMAVVANQVGG